MAEAIISRRGGALKIAGQDEVQAKYAGAIAKYDPVVVSFTDFNILSNLSGTNGRGTGLAVSSDGEYLAAAGYSSPYIAVVFKRDGDSYTKISPDLSIPSICWRGMAFLPTTGTHLAIGHNDSPFVTIYKRAGDNFSKLSNPAVLPSYDVRGGIAYSPDGVYLAVGCVSTSLLMVYKRSADTYTALAAPTQPPSSVHGIAFSPDGVHMAVAHGNSPYISIYKRNGDTFTKLSNPSALPPYTSRGVAFSPDGGLLVVAHDNSPYLTVYTRNGDTFTKLPNPTLLPDGNGIRPSFSTDGRYLAIAHSTGGLSVYRRDGNNLEMIGGATPMLSAVGDLTFLPNTAHIAVGHETSPYVSICEPNVTAQRSDSVADAVGAYGLGYAKQAGTIGDIRTIVRLWR